MYELVYGSDWFWCVFVPNVGTAAMGVRCYYLLFWSQTMQMWCVTIELKTSAVLSIAIHIEKLSTCVVCYTFCLFFLIFDVIITIFAEVVVVELLYPSLLRGVNVYVHCTLFCQFLIVNKEVCAHIYMELCKFIGLYISVVGVFDIVWYCCCWQMAFLA